MAIRFNLGGILAAVISVAVIILLLERIPGFEESRYADLVAGGVIFLVGVAFELVSLRPRILLIPVWLLGLLTMGYQSWRVWGWRGPAAWLAVAGLAIALAARYGKRVLADDLVRRVAAKDKLLAHAGKWDEQRVRAGITSLLIDSRVDLDSREAVRLNADLAALALRQFPGRFTRDQAGLLWAYCAKLQRAMGMPDIDFREFPETEQVAAVIRGALA